MRIALNGLTALKAWRSIRSGKAARITIGKRASLAMPDPSPAQRWMPRCFDLGLLGLDDVPSRGHPIHVAVPEARLRIRTAGVTCTTYTKLPDHAFVEVGGGIQIACPELVFLEMGLQMAPIVQLLLGYELCGTYSRDPLDPRSGDVTYSLDPLTTPESIAAFARGCGRIHGAAQSREMLAHVLPNAWSPMEALVAALLELDHGHLGYDLGPLELNPRVQTGEKSTRVPDILFTGTRLGINYDSSMHLDDRSRLVDDKRRTRELLSAGVSVLPMTSEDLSEKGGFDRLARQVMDFLEASEGRGVSRQRAFWARKRVQKERQELIWSLMPGNRGVRMSREAAGAEATEPWGIVEVELPPVRAAQPRN